MQSAAFLSSFFWYIYLNKNYCFAISLDWFNYHQLLWRTPKSDDKKWIHICLDHYNYCVYRPVTRDWLLLSHLQTNARIFCYTLIYCSDLFRNKPEIYLIINKYTAYAFQVYTSTASLNTMESDKVVLIDSVGISDVQFDVQNQRAGFKNLIADDQSKKPDSDGMADQNLDQWFKRQQGLIVTQNKPSWRSVDFPIILSCFTVVFCGVFFGLAAFILACELKLQCYSIFLKQRILL